MYLPITLNHFRALKAWTDSCNAQVTLDIKTFALEVKFRNRYYTLQPRFVTEDGDSGRMSYATELADNARGFIGWLPYDILQWDLSQNKLLFKAFLKKSGLKCPSLWHAGASPNEDFLLKGAAGSFGYQIAGPYRPGDQLPEYKEPNQTGTPPNFFEQFVPGTNLKVWFWGTKAIFAHVHPYPTIVGTGELDAHALVASRLAAVGTSYTGRGDQAAIGLSLKFQGVQLSDVLATGRETWIDFRYGRRYQTAVATHQSDNDLTRVNKEVRLQIDEMGEKLGDAAARRFKAPVLYSVDCVVDAAGDVWWLEVNSNPMLPPDGYPFIFKSLFGGAKP